MLTERMRELTRDEVKTLIRDLWELRLRNSSAAVDRYIAPDVRYRVNGAPDSIAMTHTVHGRDAFRETLRYLDAAIEIMDFIMDEPIVDGAEAAHHWRAVLRNRGTGGEFPLDVLDHIVFDDGLIVSYTEFLDTERLALLMAGEPPLPPMRGRFGPLLAQQETGEDEQPAPRDVIADCLRCLITERPMTDSGLSSLLTDDASFEIVADSLGAVTLPRVISGRSEIARALRTIDRDRERTVLCISTVLIDGHRAAMRWTSHHRHRATHVEREIETFALFEMRGDRIMRIKQFLDPRAINVMSSS
jgi:ketosteroid isomerase-like protein